MYIGLDLGTSGLKGILIDENQTILAEAVAPLTVQRPHDAGPNSSPQTGLPPQRLFWINWRSLV